MTYEPKTNMYYRFWLLVGGDFRDNRQEHVVGPLKTPGVDDSVHLEDRTREQAHEEARRIVERIGTQGFWHSRSEYISPAAVWNIGLEYCGSYQSNDGGQTAIEGTEVAA